MACAEIVNGWQSPRISFSLDLSQADRISPDKRKREEPIAVDYNTEFEFCIVSTVNSGREAVFGEGFISADELFVDGKLLPQTCAPEVGAQPQAEPLTIARHISLETAKCPSPVRSTSYPPSKSMINLENAAAKSGSRSGKWKEMFRLSNREYFFSSSKEIDESGKDSNAPKARSSSSSSSMWPFLRSRSIGAEPPRGSGIFCSMPFSRSYSVGERKSMAGFVTSCYGCKSSGTHSAVKETDTLLREAGCPEELKKAPEASKELKKVSEASTEPKKVPQVSTELNKVSEIPRRRLSPGRTLRTRRGGSSPARNYGNGGRFVVRNATPVTLDSPRPGRPMAEGLVKANNCNLGSGMGVRVNPVLNVPACMGPVGGRNGPGLFGFRGFFTRRENKRSSHHGGSTNRKKGA